MSNYERVDLLTAAAATGAWQDWPGGSGAFFAGGAFGGATVALEADTSRSGGGDAGAVRNQAGTAISLTAAGVLAFELPPCRIRGAISGGAGVSVNAHAVRINP